MRPNACATAPAIFQSGSLVGGVGFLIALGVASENPKQLAAAHHWECEHPRDRRLGGVQIDDHAPSPHRDHGRVIQIDTLVCRKISGDLMYSPDASTIHTLARVARAY